MSNTRFAAIQGWGCRTPLSTSPHGSAGLVSRTTEGEAAQGRIPMKSVSLSEASLPSQIWNSAPQLDSIAVINTQSLVPAGARAVLIAPHPGDEVVTCGGLL